MQEKNEHRGTYRILTDLERTQKVQIMSEGKRGLLASDDIACYQSTIEMCLLVNTILYPIPHTEDRTRGRVTYELVNSAAKLCACLLAKNEQITTLTQLADVARIYKMRNRAT